MNLEAELATTLPDQRFNHSDDSNVGNGVILQELKVEVGNINNDEHRITNL